MNSIRRNLTASLFAASAALLVAGFATALLLLRHELYRQIDERLDSAARMIAVEIAEDTVRLSAEAVDKEARELEDQHVVPRYWEVIGEDGRSLARSDALAGHRIPLPKRLKGPRMWTLRLGDDGHRVRALATRGREPTGGGFTVVVAADQDEIDEVMSRSGVAGVATVILFLGLSFWMVTRILRRGLAPLDSLGEQMGGIGVESLGAQFPPERFPLELRPVVTQFNALLARLGQSFERERRVNADLAHELRTPVAELRLLAETALKWPESRDADTDRNALATATRMEALVERMLLLARGERQKLPAQQVEVDVDALLADAWRPLAGRAAEKLMDVHMAATAGRTTADPILLRSILVNLMENAVSHGPRGSDIAIDARADAGVVTIAVTNAAPDLAPADVAHLFERYWRKEAARGGDELHVGLGLAIVKTFTEAMGWSVAAQLDAGLLTVTVTSRG